MSAANPSPEVVQYQLSNISILQSMYPSPSELAIAPSSIPLLRALQSTPPGPFGATEDRVELVHATTLDQGAYELTLSLPLRRPRVEVSLRQPSWLTRSEWESIRDLEPSADEELVVEYLVQAQETVRRRIEALPKYAQEEVKPDISASSSSSTTQATKSCLERVWFWFPSLSSKEKRKDLVTFAEEHLLSGFLLAGKLSSPPRAKNSVRSAPLMRQVNRACCA